jgi:hypothetical protein
MASTYTFIASSTVGGGGAANIEFTSIPATYTDLLVKLSSRASDAVNVYALKFEFNSNASNYSSKYLYGTGSGSGSSISTTDSFTSYVNGSNATASTFTSSEFYVPNYASSNNKSFSIDYATENNATLAIAGITAGLWSNTAAITSIKFILEGGNFAQYSSAYLYGITKS